MTSEGCSEEAGFLAVTLASLPSFVTLSDAPCRSRNWRETNMPLLFAASLPNNQERIGFSKNSPTTSFWICLVIPKVNHCTPRPKPGMTRFCVPVSFDAILSMTSRASNAGRTMPLLRPVSGVGKASFNALSTSAFNSLSSVVCSATDFLESALGFLVGATCALASLTTPPFRRMSWNILLTIGLIPEPSVWIILLANPAKFLMPE